VRATSEFPDGPQRARTELMIARIYLDARQWAPGCAAVEEGRMVVGAQDVELRNQLAYLAQQCASAGVAAAAGPADARGAALAGPATDSVSRAERDAARAAARDSVRATEMRPAHPVRATRAADTARATAATATTSAVTPPSPRVASTPSRPATATPAPEPSPTAPRATPRAPGFSVQVAAFDRTAPARDLAETLRRDGWDARVDADAQWQRVRVGYFATRAEATELARRLMAKGVNGFVTGVGGR
jgi:cell division septation protein DedD